jgi:AraC-like DNA-binding protein
MHQQKAFSKKEITPVYCLENFGKEAQDNDFYIEKLSTHLRQHEFVSHPHKHDFYMILYIAKGSGDHRIDFTNYKISAHLFFLMTPGQVHAWKLQKGTDGYIIFFTRNFYQMQLNDSSLIEFPFFHALNPNPVIKTNEGAIRNLIGELYQEYTDASAKDTRMLRSYLDLLLLKLARHYNSNEDVTLDGESFKLRKLEQLIEGNFTLLKQPRDYADRMNLSSSYLNTICKVNLNKTLSQLIQERVTLEAKRLLAYTDLTVNEISVQLNFSGTSHFIRYFRNTAGITPEQFKESMIRTI